MKTKDFFPSLLFCLVSLSLQAQAFSGSIRPDIYHSNTLTGMWRLIHFQQDSLILLNYYKVFQPDSSFFAFELDPVKGNLPTSYGYYTRQPDGTFSEYTLGDCRNPNRKVESDMEYVIQENCWLHYKFRTKGSSKWGGEYYIRVSRENPYYLYDLTKNWNKKMTAQQQFWKTNREIQTEIQKYVTAKQYDKAILYCKKQLLNYEAVPLILREEMKEIKANALYNIACYYSLLDQKNEAIQNLAWAVDAGYDSYHHALNDPDLMPIRKEKCFTELLERMRPTGDYPFILKNAPAYRKDTTRNLPSFIYTSASDPALAKLRHYFNLDSIAGDGDEISKIKNLLLWVHQTVRHDGNSDNPPLRNAIDLIKICQKENRGVNCRMMAIILNECYLAMGFKSRFVTCLPKIMKSDCHVINTVYSETLKKWLWMDPTFNAYVTDKKGNLLSIAEVREYLRTGKKLILNPDANWNNQPKSKEEYLDQYMAKNLFYMSCYSLSAPNIETENNDYAANSYFYVSLIPPGYQPDTWTEIKTTDDRYFWQKPE